MGPMINNQCQHNLSVFIVSGMNKNGNERIQDIGDHDQNTGPEGIGHTHAIPVDNDLKG
jgi:hypothetical protein